MTPPPLTVGAVGAPELTVRLDPLVAVPARPTTVTVPLVVPAATTAVICVVDMTEYDATAVPFMLTPVIELKFVPLMVTVEPTQTDGVPKPVIVGGAATTRI
jgi:hypothetical protein